MTDWKILGLLAKCHTERTRIHKIESNSQPKAKPNTLAVCTLLGLLFFASRCGASEPGSQDPRTAAEAEAYKERIELTHVGLARGENYLGDTVYYVEGTIKNSGEKAIQRIDLTFLFKDSLNQVVLKEMRRALEYKGSRGLESQKTASFQVGFDRLPKDWNYVVPEVQITTISLK